MIEDVVGVVMLGLLVGLVVFLLLAIILMAGAQLVTTGGTGP